MDKMELRPQNGLKTVWGWQHSKTGEVLNAAYAYFDGAYEAEVDKPNQGKPLEETPPAVVKTLKIKTQPAAALTTPSGTPVSVGVVGEITNGTAEDVVKYQWQVKAPTESMYANATGETNSEYSITLEKASTGTRVRCLVTYDTQSITSSVCEITVTAAAV